MSIEFYYRIDYIYTFSKGLQKKDFEIVLNKSDVDEWIRKHKHNKRYRLINVTRCMSM